MEEPRRALVLGGVSSILRAIARDSAQPTAADVPIERHHRIEPSIHLMTGAPWLDDPPPTTNCPGLRKPPRQFFGLPARQVVFALGLVMIVWLAGLVGALIGVQWAQQRSGPLRKPSTLGVNVVEPRNERAAPARRRGDRQRSGAERRCSAVLPRRQRSRRREHRHRPDRDCRRRDRDQRPRRG